MVDAGILCWRTKWNYVFWRPILGIRHADEEGNDATEAVADWTPLDSPSTNSHNKNFIPNFPAYASGHASFGGALFRVLQHFYRTDELSFEVISDEFNAITTDDLSNIHPFKSRRFHRLSDAAQENDRSRIYLGVHWQFDADEGLRSGTAIADHVFATILLPDTATKPPTRSH